jgi:tetratricopeptide (TPR) repeat protein
VNDAIALKQVLCARYGFQDEDVSVLFDDEATGQAIMNEFIQLTRLGRDGIALFHFAGNGSTNSGGEPVIISHDGRQKGIYDISLQNLSELAGRDSRLVSIIDAGFKHVSKMSAEARAIPSDRRRTPFTRSIKNASVTWDLGSPQLKVGAVSIYRESIVVREPVGSTQQKAARDKERGTFSTSSGTLTGALVATLGAAELGVKYRDLVRDAAGLLTNGSLVILGGPLDVPVFGNIEQSTELVSSLMKLSRGFLDELIDVLRRLIERRNGAYADVYVSLGIALAVKGEYESALTALDRAIQQDSENTDAHYWVGRTLLESGGDLFRAVSELREATRREPEFAQAQFYLGQAIRVVVEQEFLAEAERAFVNYLSAGAPLGESEAVQKFLHERQNATPKTKLG